MAGRLASHQNAWCLVVFCVCVVFCYLRTLYGYSILTVSPQISALCLVCIGALDSSSARFVDQSKFGRRSERCGRKLINRRPGPSLLSRVIFDKVLTKTVKP